MTERTRDLWQEMAVKLAREELRLIEQAVRTWAEQCGVTVEEWARCYGYQTERVFVDGEVGLPTENHSVRIVVRPVKLREPPESWPVRPWY